MKCERCGCEKFYYEPSQFYCANCFLHLGIEQSSVLAESMKTLPYPPNYLSGGELEDEIKDNPLTDGERPFEEGNEQIFLEERQEERERNARKYRQRIERRRRTDAFRGQIECTLESLSGLRRQDLL